MGDEIFDSKAKAKAEEVLSYIKDKDENDYDYTILIRFAKWWNEEVANKTLRRELALKLANEISTEGTDSKVVLETAQAYFNFIVNN
jgi:hypothetical protein